MTFHSHRLTAALALLVLLAGAGPARGGGIVWERGTLSGTQDVGAAGCVTGRATGTFSFDTGDEEIAGVDYSAANPGAFDVCVAGAQFGSWDGTFTASNLVFGSTSGTYALSPSLPVLVGHTLQMDGPISFDPQPPLSPLPPGLGNLKMSATVTVTSLLGGGDYTFSGPFLMTGELLVFGPPAALNTNAATDSGGGVVRCTTSRASTS